MNFPYKWHISSKIRRDLAIRKIHVLFKTRLIFSRINGPNVQPKFKKTVRSFVTTLMPVVRKDVAGSKEMLSQGR